ncbi:MAG TPA: hypothetical protein VKS20_10940 [Candidatus Acidoferrales bacterium]|nr:hypothetical protein [Candidatus Acidoferrales bacterium]
MRVTAYFCGPGQIEADEPAEVSLIGGSEMKKRMAKKITHKGKTKRAHPKRKTANKQGQNLQPANYLLE